MTKYVFTSVEIFFSS